MLGDEFGIAAVKFRLYEDDMYIFAAAGINQGFQMCRRRFFATGFDGNLMQSVVAGEIRECRVVNHKGTADKVERPKKQRYIADYYRQEELERLLEASKDHPYSLLIQMTAFYGLRRSEALGLKWDAIDFERDTITIKHIVTNAKIDGKCEIVCADRAKTKSSLRSLPLVSNIREKLLALREQQKENRRVCGNCYSKKYDGYVFVDAMGNIFNPRSVTANFSKLLEQNGLRHIRFHDLRHSCASLLLANDVPLKQIQEWLGHSDIGTTANIYSHLDYKSKITSANVMDNILTLPDTRQTGWHT